MNCIRTYLSQLSIQRNISITFHPNRVSSSSHPKEVIFVFISCKTGVRGLEVAYHSSCPLTIVFRIPSCSRCVTPASSLLVPTCHIAVPANTEGQVCTRDWKVCEDIRGSFLLLLSLASLTASPVSHSLLPRISPPPSHPLPHLVRVLYIVQWILKKYI